MNLESSGTVGRPVSAADRAPTLSIDCSTSRPLISNLDPLDIFKGIIFPFASVPHKFSLPLTVWKFKELAPSFVTPFASVLIKF